MPDALEALSRQGWAILDGFIDSHTVESLRSLIEADFNAGEFKKAGIGRGQNFRIDTNIRADFVRWLDDYQGHPVVHQVEKQFDELRTAINRELFLGLKELEAHLTKYPPGPGYAKHLDRFTDRGTRTLSLVLYLNDSWKVDDGGALRIFDRADSDVPQEDLVPLSGRLVLFLSDEIWHEVMPTRRDRYSLTGWFLR